jgi:hypothetical protein
MRQARPILALAAGYLLATGLPAADRPADDEVRTTVEHRVTEWWPTDEEKRFDRIGWAADLRTARKLAAEHDRPVFLFTMDGRVNLGRC